MINCYSGVSKGDDQNAALSPSAFKASGVERVFSRSGVAPRRARCPEADVPAFMTFLKKRRADHPPPRAP